MADLATLFGAAFLAATLLPFPSEAVLFAYVALHPDRAALAVAVATVGNTAGGMATYLVGRLIPQKQLDPRAMVLLRRWGAPATLLGFLPVVGEAICVAAGWLRVHWLAALLFTAAGRLARYLAVVWGTLLAG
ncbi:MAG TPA: DedA family protein [Burkholderiales bacterium]|nr:DedA family protein [Burkholderiales bacterium]